ncbi:MBL fold metallo-hydrolase [Ahrensia sp. R2A130]|uniref:MBL fold metallo-hydrolase n=1 Tax=Ahrensia sp. R2A130 TaxID=744979 RepID=UPI0001E0C9B1|nr:MBL fold metallo-hydrolase [Ahrensia sp. R2A130]EFL90266.1 phnp protein [Ahrensia sp. R2A130]
MADLVGQTRFTILGCGSSPGVPRIADDWGNCDPKNPKNRRRRASMLVEKFGPDGTTTVVIDTGPDFREQMITAGISWADAVVYTHSHADHIHGIDDLRSFVINDPKRRRVPIWADDFTSQRLHEGFGYCFETPEGSNYPPILDENRIVAKQPFTISGAGGDIELLPFEQPHGNILSLGFRIGNVAYCSDVSALDERALPYLENLDVWIIDALQYREHPSHLSLDQTLAWIEKLKPQRAILTHMHTPLDYETVLAATPDHVEPAFDGLQFKA